MPPQATRHRGHSAVVLSLFVGVLSLLLASAGRAAATSLTEVQFRAERDQFRFVLQADAPLPTPSREVLTDPPRLELFYAGVELRYNAGAAHVFPIDRGKLVSVKVAPSSEPTGTRLVFLFTNATNPSTLANHLITLPGEGGELTLLLGADPYTDAQRQAIKKAAQPAGAPATYEPLPLEQSGPAIIRNLIHEKFGQEHDRFKFRGDGTVPTPIVTLDGPRLTCRFDGAQFTLPASATTNEFQAPVNGAVVREFHVTNESDGSVVLLMVLDPPSGFTLNHRLSRNAPGEVQLDVEFLTMDVSPPAAEPLAEETPDRLPTPSESAPDAGQEQIAVLAGGEAAEGVTITQINFETLKSGLGERYTLVATAPFAGEMERLSFPDRLTYTVREAEVALPAGVGDRFTIPLSSDLVEDLQVVLRREDDVPVSQISWRLRTSATLDVAVLVSQEDPRVVTLDFTPAPREASPEPAIEPEVIEIAPEPAAPRESTGPMNEIEAALAAQPEAPAEAEAPAVEEAAAVEEAPVTEEPVAIEAEPVAEPIAEEPIADEPVAIEVAPVAEPEPAIELPVEVVEAEPVALAEVDITRTVHEGIDEFAFASEGPFEAQVDEAKFPNRLVLTFAARPIAFAGQPLTTAKYLKEGNASNVRVQTLPDGRIAVQILLKRSLDALSYAYDESGNRATLRIEALPMPEPVAEPLEIEATPTPAPEPALEEPVAVEEPAPVVEEDIEVIGDEPLTDEEQAAEAARLAAAEEAAAAAESPAPPAVIEIEPAPEPEPIVEEPVAAEPEPEPMMEEPVAVEPEPAIEEPIELDAEPEPAIEEPVAVEPTPEPAMEPVATEATPDPAIELPAEVVEIESPETAPLSGAQITGIAHRTENGADIFEIAYTGQLGEPAATWLKYPSQLGVSLFDAQLAPDASSVEAGIKGLNFDGAKLARGGNSEHPAVRVSLYLSQGFSPSGLSYRLNTTPGLVTVTVTGQAAPVAESAPRVEAAVKVDDSGAPPAAPTTPATPPPPGEGEGAAKPAAPGMLPGTGPVTGMRAEPRKSRYFANQQPEGGEPPVQVVEEPLVDLNIKEAAVSDVLEIIAEQYNLNIVIDPKVDQEVTIRVTEQPVTKVFDILAAQAEVKWFIDDAGIYIFGDEEDLKTRYGSLYQETWVYEPKYANAQNILQVIRTLKFVGTNDVQVYRTRTSASANAAGGATPATEKLIIRVTPALRPEVERVVRQIDSPPYLIHIDVKLLTLSDRAATQSGIRWSSRAGGNNTATGAVSFVLDEKTPGSVNFDPVTGETAPAIGNPDFDFFSGFQRDPANRISVQAAINFILETGQGEVLQNPSLTITSGGRGRLFVGETVPFRSTFQVSDLGRVTQRVQQESIGMQVEVSARADVERGLVNMIITPNLNSLLELTEIGPRTSDNQFTSTIVIPSGESYILAGLINDSNSVTVTSVPILGDLPLIGKLFRSKTKVFNRGELVLIITPTILNPYGHRVLGSQFPEYYENDTIPEGGLLP